MTTRTAKKTEQDVYQSKLYLAFELSNMQWKLGFAIGHRKRPRLCTITAGELMALQDEIHWAKQRFRLSGDIPIVSCYEAGRDGFWLHRHLTSVGIANLIIDSASDEYGGRGSTFRVGGVRWQTENR